ncbi:hypothetical protein MRBL20_001694 [Peribacillus frigoritolerans]
MSHTVIAENKKPIEIDEDSEQKPKELGTFKLGEKVNVVGHIITLTNVHYTKERTNWKKHSPKKYWDLIFNTKMVQKKNK